MDIREYLRGQKYERWLTNAFKYTEKRPDLRLVE